MFSKGTFSAVECGDWPGYGVMPEKVYGIIPIDPVRI